MWDDPIQLNRISRWLFVLAGMLIGIVATRALTEGMFPFRQVTILGARQHETRLEVTQVVRQLRGGFFTMNLMAARRAFEALPWVRNATVRRLWPNRLLVEVSEHIPAASWNGQSVLDTQGDLFQVTPWPGLPRVYAPEGTEKEVARRLADFYHILVPAGWHVASLQVSPRMAWRLSLVGGVSLELGRDRLDERIRRFVRFYPLAVAVAGPITQIDLRYPNGFAAQRPKGGRGRKHRGRTGAA
jgi:cell division protein FtsQ